MNYLRQFYNQESKFEVSLNFMNRSYLDYASFGLSGIGNSGVNIEVSGGAININKKFVSCLDDVFSPNFIICGNSGKVTVWENENPILFLYETGFSFNTIYCNAVDGSVFSENLLGSRPELIHYVSGLELGLKSGNLSLYNPGKFNLDVSSINLDNSILSFDNTPFTIAPSSFKYIPLVYNSNSSFSGTGNFLIETNAGLYDFDQYFDIQTYPLNQNLNIYFDNTISYPTGKANFYIENVNNSEVNFQLFLDFFEKQTPYIKTGFANYNPGTGNIFVNYTGGGFFTPVIGSGALQIIGTGQTSETVQYSQNFTGIGGRLNATGVQNFSGEFSSNSIVSGSNIFYIQQIVDVYEGNGNHFDLWSISYKDYDRGLENFKSLSRYTSSGFGVTGINYRIPANSRTSGSVNYVSNYGDKIFQSLILRATDGNSLEKTAYIQVN